jgi:hypothetical protein
MNTNRNDNYSDNSPVGNNLSYCFSVDFRKAGESGPRCIGAGWEVKKQMQKTQTELSEESLLFEVYKSGIY